MQRRIIFLTFLMLFFLFSCDWIKNTFGPTEPEPIDPDKYGGKIEILYERVKQMTNPDAPDLTKGAPTIYHGKLGGQNTSKWVPAGENKWTAFANLQCHSWPYYIWVNDYVYGEVVDGVHVGHQVAQDIYLRREGENNWIKLTVIADNPMTDGKAAKFKFYNGKIQNPSE